jgi:hypothetical protein
MRCLPGSREATVAGDRNLRLDPSTSARPPLRAESGLEVDAIVDTGRARGAFEIKLGVGQDRRRR